MDRERKLLYLAIAVAVVSETTTFLVYRHADDARAEALQALTQCNNAVAKLSDAYDACHGKPSSRIDLRHHPSDDATHL